MEYEWNNSKIKIGRRRHIITMSCFFIHDELISERPPAIFRERLTADQCVVIEEGAHIQDEYRRRLNKHFQVSCWCGIKDYIGHCWIITGCKFAGLIAIIVTSICTFVVVKRMHAVHLLGP